MSDFDVDSAFNLDSIVIEVEPKEYQISYQSKTSKTNGTYEKLYTFEKALTEQARMDKIYPNYVHFISKKKASP